MKHHVPGRTSLLLFLCPLWIAAAGAQTPDSDGPIVVNTLLSGYYQIQNQDPAGWPLLAGTPLATFGLYLASKDEQFEFAGLSVTSKSLGFAVQEFGFSEYAFSNYDAIQRALLQNQNPITFFDALTAPVDPQNLLDYRVTPLILIRAISSLRSQFSLLDLAQESGTPLKPSSSENWTTRSFTMVTGYLAGPAEELIFHGMFQPTLIARGVPEQWAVGITALLFSAAHVANAFVTHPATMSDWFRLVSQVAETFFVGWYNGELALDGSEGLKRAIAVHSLGNVTWALASGIVAEQSQRSQ